MDFLSATSSTVYYIVYPVFYIVYLVLHTLAIVTSPLLHLGHYLLYACFYPIHILAKFETLYIFFGVAVLVGLLTGTSLHYASTFLISLFDFEKRHAKPKPRIPSSYRAEKQESLEKDLSPQFKQKGLPIIDGALKEEEDVGWGRLNKDRRKRRKGLPNTIIEEDDSTEDGF